MSLPSDGPYKCIQCDKEFSSNTILRKHIKIHTGEKPYKCNLCEKTFSKQYDLKRHSGIHSGEKPFQCTHCPSAFARRDYLTKHIRKHTGEKLYQCNICDKAFSQKKDLTNHNRIHTGEKPFQCTHCPLAFARRDYLTKHITKHTGEKLYQCNICDQAFFQKNALTIHNRIHTGENPYQCHICGQSFSQKNYLTKHNRVHTGEKPYQCHLCDQAFSQKNDLTKHNRMHTGEKPYNCDHCDNAFSQQGNLMRHIMTHTGEKPYQFVYGDLEANYKDSQWLCFRAIIAPTNNDVDIINEKMINKFPGECKIFKSADKVESNEDVFPLEYMNKETPPGFPPHQLKLKKYAPIILLRNIDPANGHCNGTKYVINQMTENVLDAVVAGGVHAGKRLFIPRISLSSPDSHSYSMIRKQFPVRLAFGITANKSQGQTLKKVGISLRSIFFSHGQFYVACSRVESSKNLKIWIKNSKDNVYAYTDNVVYSEVL